jgi:hypothetical protein
MSITRAATRSELVAALAEAIRSKHVVKASAWDRGGVVHSIASDALAARDILVEVHASFDARTLEYRGAFDITINLHTLTLA